MKKLFTGILLLFSLSLYGQEKEVNSFINEIKTNHIRQDLDSFYLNCNPIKCYISYDWLISSKDSMSKYLDKQEINFIYSLFDTAKYKHNIELKPHNLINTFDYKVIDRALPANHDIYKGLNNINTYHIKWFGLFKKNQIKIQDKRRDLNTPQKTKQVYSFSIPVIFNNIAFFSVYKYRSSLGSNGATYLYKKINNKWKLITPLYGWSN